MDALSAIFLLQTLAGLAALYAAMRSLSDWRDGRKRWAIVGLIVAVGGLMVTFARLPVLEARVEIVKT